MADVALCAGDTAALAASEPAAKDIVADAGTDLISADDDDEVSEPWRKNGALCDERLADALGHAAAGDHTAALASLDSALPHAEYGSARFATVLRHRAAMLDGAGDCAGAETDLQWAEAGGRLLEDVDEGHWRRMNEEIWIEKEPPLDADSALYLGATATFPERSSAVSVGYSPAEGRYLVAAADIPAGAVLLDERPYASALFDAAAAHFCQQCYKPAPAAWLPCRRCSERSVRYCSPACLNAGWRGAHEFECGALRAAARASCSLLVYSQLLALRIVLRSPAELIRQTVKVPLADCDTGYTPHSLRTVADRFRLVATLVANETPVERMDKAERCAAAVRNLTVRAMAGRLAEALRDHTEYFRRRWEPSAVADGSCVRDTAEMLYRLILQLSCNKQGIRGTEKLRADVAAAMRRTEGYKATAVYSNSVLMNHSCAPNTSLVWADHGRLTVRATVDIKAGSRISNCYGPRVGREATAARRRHLRNMYSFECACHACTSPDVALVERCAGAYRCPICPDAAGEPLHAGDRCAHCALPIDEQFVSRTRALIGDMDKLSADPAAVLQLLSAIECRLHGLNTRLEPVRAGAAAALLKSADAKHAADAVAVLRRHCVAVKARFGADTLKLSVELVPLAMAHRAAGDGTSFMRTAAQLLRIQRRHHGGALLRRLFAGAAGLEPFVPLIDCMNSVAA